MLSLPAIGIGDESSELVMNFRELEYVIAVAEEQSFTRAARRCHVVQSALSAQIARLERELGVRLFDRTSRSVSLTPAGEILLAHASRLLDAAAAARAEIAAYTGLLTGRLKLGMIGGAFRELPTFEHALVTFHQRHPAVEITVHDSGSRQMADEVHAGNLDLAVVGLYADQIPAGLAHRLLADEPLAAVVGHTHPLATSGHVTLDELAASSPLAATPARSGIRIQIDNAFAQAQIAPRVAFELGAPDAVLRFVELGLAFSLVPASVGEHAPGVTALPLRNCTAGHPLGLIHRTPLTQCTPSTTAFLTILDTAQSA